MQRPTNRYLFCVLCLALIGFSCSKNDVTPTPAPITEDSTISTTYSISGTKILYTTNAVQLIGANTFHTFGAGSRDMNAWSMDIAREFVGNMKETPLTGWAIQATNGAYMHSLQAVVDSNRLNRRITILCAFGWDGNAATEFTGTRPTQTTWWNDYKIKLRQWAVQFKNQPDVWLEVWNEPYRYDRADGYTDAIWVSDMTEMLNIIRGAGNNNIVLLPCAEQGQDESVLVNKGVSFLSGKKNILFDVHAYEKWLLTGNANIGTRLAKLKQLNLPVFFGEVAPMNAGTLMNPQAFLDSVYNRGLSVSAWVWKNDGTDLDALMNANGTPNNNNNNNWGSTFKTLAARPRRP